MNNYQKFIYLRTYARYLWGENRRETWEETVSRYCDFVFTNPAIPEKVKRICKQKILNLEVMPSMRALWTAGEAAARTNETMYNCAFTPIDDLDAFGEILFLLMCGCGVGFSVEGKYVEQLPTIRNQRYGSPRGHIIQDSREGWKQALEVGLETWFEGRDVYFDYSCLRQKGAPLKTMGGRSSGPEPLRQLLGFVRELIMQAQGRQLRPLEVHDICCETSNVVVAGGTRRSALISLSDLINEAMRHAKDPGCHPRRFGANNSTIYNSMPDILTFLDEWVSLARSGRGERGIANLWAARRNAPHRRKSKLITGLNPCGEVTLRAREFCNVTEVVIRPDDDFESLRDKITSATWLGVIQSTFTDFKHLGPQWKENCDEERLIGVSLTGQFDNPGLLTPEILRLSKAHTVNVARKAAKILGINMPAATTTVKPSGTVSKLVNSSAGLHPRWSKYYLQNVEISKEDPLYRMLIDQGVPSFDAPEADHTAIVSFPIKSPEGAITRHDLSALEQLQWYEKLVENWCEHNASCTVYVGKNEWLSVAAWVYDHFDKVNGIAFFPKDEAKQSYPWMPNVEITQAEYEKLAGEFPNIDFNRLSDYENDDQTTGSRELACAGGACEI